MKIGIISDIHSNIVALKVCIEYMESISCDEYLFLGDYVSDTPYTRETMDYLYDFMTKASCYFLNKPFEDGFSYEYDHDLVMNAGKEEMLNDNELNTSDRIYVSTHFQGSLSDGRYIIHDSPGVNYSRGHEHKEIADRLIKAKKYNMLIYVMNSTQLATNDEDEHLDFVKQRIGRTPVLFVMNKVDSFDVEEEDIFATIHRQTAYLKRDYKR